jgi:REP element-mobilizing transposase RayT
VRPLSPEERQIVKADILFWHERRWRVHALTVMPDQVHVLATPLEMPPGRWHSLSDMLHSVKRGSALKINRLRGTRGPLWQSESFDPIIRNEQEFQEKAAYILSNAVKTRLVADGWRYDGFWCEGMSYGRAGSKPAQACVSTPVGPDTPGPRGRGIPPDALIIKRRRKLPHWQLAGSTYLATFRLSR